MAIIRQITDAIAAVEGVKLLDIDPGKDTNRTVVTFVGEPIPVLEAAYRAIAKAAELIDMRHHKGEHPRFGATDVCPLIPLSNISMEETVQYAQQLAQRVGRELHIPVYLYEQAATTPERKNLANVRAGEYEGLPEKLAQPQGKPDAGPHSFDDRVARTGATAIGARDFLIAYNVNLNTTSTRRANAVAFDVREAGRVLRQGDPITGEVVRDANGEPVRIPGKLKSVKAIGWYLEQYGICQISMNLTNITATPLHIAFEEVCRSAESRGMRVTGSEIVGLVPLKALTDAGKYFLAQQQRSEGVSEEELVKIAIRTLGLSDVQPFDPAKKVIEYILQDSTQNPLVRLSLRDFANETASESPAPGGGSIAAYVGALGAALGTMVANLSAHKRGWDDRWATFSAWAAQGQAIKEELLRLTDEDTHAFNGIMAALQLPKNTPAEKEARQSALQQATQQAIATPLQVMKTALSAMDLLETMAKEGNPNSVSDAGVGASCLNTAVKGAYLNVLINSKGLDNNAEWVQQTLASAQQMLHQAATREGEILAIVNEIIQKST